MATRIIETEKEIDLQEEAERIVKKFGDVEPFTLKDFISALKQEKIKFSDEELSDVISLMITEDIICPMGTTVVGEKAIVSEFILKTKYE